MSKSRLSHILRGMRSRFDLKKVAATIVIAILTFAAGFFLRDLIVRSEVNVQLLSGLPNQATQPINPYRNYTFANLATQNFVPQPITILEKINSTPQFDSYLISWQVPQLDNALSDLSTNTKSSSVSAKMNIPRGNGPFPIIIMLRGYAEREQYYSGLGTDSAATVLAQNGYITVAPDFLGYGQSGPESEDILLARFARPVTVLQLLANLRQPNLIDKNNNPNYDTYYQQSLERVFAKDRLGIWAHSNGGQIALSILEITGRNIPTTLWAPVSKPFPYSILYFTDELEDQGKYIRQQLAYFEQDLENNVGDYSILQHPEKITAPLQLHQGGADDAVPLEWSQELAETLGEAEVKISFYQYPQADHNLRPDWETVMQRDLRFFASELKE